MSEKVDWKVFPVLKMRTFVSFIVILAVLSKVWAFCWTPNSMIQRSSKLRMVSAIDIKPSIVASVPEIQDDDSNRGKGNMRPRAAGFLEMPRSDAARRLGAPGLLHTDFEAGAAAEQLGPLAHAETAEALAPLLTDLLA